MKLAMRGGTFQTGESAGTIHSTTRTSQCSWLGTLGVWEKVTEDEIEVWEDPNNIELWGFLKSTEKSLTVLYRKRHVSIYLFKSFFLIFQVQLVNKQYYITFRSNLPSTHNPHCPMKNR